MIERIKESRASNEIDEPSHKEAAIDEYPATEDLVEETPAPTQSKKEEESQSNEALIEETQVQETQVEESSDKVAIEAEEDGPLEDWTLKELKEECKTIGVSEKGKKQILLNALKNID